MLNRILVITPKDPKETAAIRKGMSLAALTGARLEIIDFCHEDLEDISQHTDTSEAKLKKTIMEHKSGTLEASIKTVRQSDPSYKDLNINSKVIWENLIYEWIIKKTTNENFDLVIKTGRRSETTFYTPTDFHLLRGCRAPVYLLTARKWKKKSTVLVALDVEGKGRSNEKLNLQLLKIGRTMADAMNSELACCFVVNVPEILKDLDIVDVSTYKKKAREIYLPQVIKLVEAFGITKQNIYREIGKPAGCIQKIANKLKVNVLIIGTISRKGISGKLIGNTAEQVLKYLFTDMICINRHT